MRRLAISFLFLATACFEAPTTDDSQVATTGEALGAGTTKVTICHIPPGNPAAAHSITVGEPSLSAHLGHGDPIGRCRGLPTVCASDDTRACYTGAAGTEGVGACGGGYQICDGAGSTWSECREEVVPTEELCGNGIDDDCDGEVDELCTAIIGDRVWLDSNRNGSQDEGENGVSGIRVRLLDAAGHQVDAMQTDASGRYRFVVPSGPYYVQVMAPGTYRYTVADATSDASDSDMGGDGVSPLTHFAGTNSSVDCGLVMVATRTR